MRTSVCSLAFFKVFETRIVESAPVALSLQLWRLYIRIDLVKSPFSIMWHATNALSRIFCIHTNPCQTRLALKPWDDENLLFSSYQLYFSYCEPYIDKKWSECRTLAIVSLFWMSTKSRRQLTCCTSTGEPLNVWPFLHLHAVHCAWRQCMLGPSNCVWSWISCRLFKKDDPEVQSNLCFVVFSMQNSAHKYNFMETTVINFHRTYVYNMNHAKSVLGVAICTFCCTD